MASRRFEKPDKPAVADTRYKDISPFEDIPLEPPSGNRDVPFKPKVIEEPKFELQPQASYRPPVRPRVRFEQWLDQQDSKPSALDIPMRPDIQNEYIDHPVPGMRERFTSKRGSTDRGEYLDNLAEGTRAASAYGLDYFLNEPASVQEARDWTRQNTQSLQDAYMKRWEEEDATFQEQLQEYRDKPYIVSEVEENPDRYELVARQTINGEKWDLVLDRQATPQTENKYADRYTKEMLAQIEQAEKFKEQETLRAFGLQNEDANVSAGKSFVSPYSYTGQFRFVPSFEEVEPDWYDKTKRSGGVWSKTQIKKWADWSARKGWELPWLESLTGISGTSIMPGYAELGVSTGAAEMLKENVYLADGTLYTVDRSPSPASSQASPGGTYVRKVVQEDGEVRPTLVRSGAKPKPVTATLYEALQDIYPEESNDFYVEAIAETSVIPSGSASHKLEAIIKVHDLGMSWTEAIDGDPNILQNELAPLMDNWSVSTHDAFMSAVKQNPKTNWYYNKRIQELAQVGITGEAADRDVAITIRQSGLPGSQDVSNKFAHDIFFDPSTWIAGLIGKGLKTAKGAADAAKRLKYFGPSIVKGRGYVNPRILSNIYDPIKGEFTEVGLQQVTKANSNQTVRLADDIAETITDDITETVRQNQTVYQRGGGIGGLNPIALTASGAKGEVIERAYDAFTAILSDVHKVQGTVNPITGQVNKTSIKEAGMALATLAEPAPLVDDFVSRLGREAGEKAFNTAKDDWTLRTIQAANLLEPYGVARSIAGREASALLYQMVRNPATGRVDPRILAQKLLRQGKDVDDITEALVQHYDEAAETLLTGKNGKPNPIREKYQSFKEYINQVDDAGNYINDPADFGQFERGTRGSLERHRQRVAARKVVDENKEKVFDYNMGDSFIKMGLHELAAGWQGTKNIVNTGLWMLYGSLNPAYSARNYYNNMLTAMVDGKYSLKPLSAIEEFYNHAPRPYAAERGIGGTIKADIGGQQGDALGQSLADRMLDNRFDLFSGTWTPTIPKWVPGVGGKKIRIGANAIEQSTGARVAYQGQSDFLKHILVDTKTGVVPLPDDIVLTLEAAGRGDLVVNLYQDLYSGVTRNGDTMMFNVDGALNNLYDAMQTPQGWQVDLRSLQRHITDDDIILFNKIDDAGQLDIAVKKILHKADTPQEAAEQLRLYAQELDAKIAAADKRIPAGLEIEEPTSETNQFLTRVEVEKNKGTQQIDIALGIDDIERMDLSQSLNAIRVGESELAENVARKQQHIHNIMNNARANADVPQSVVDDLQERLNAANAKNDAARQAAAAEHVDLLKDTWKSHDNIAKIPNIKPEQISRRRERLWRGETGYHVQQAIRRQDLQAEMVANLEEVINYAMRTDADNLLQPAIKYSDTPLFSPVDPTSYKYTLDPLITRLDEASRTVEGVVPAKTVQLTADQIDDLSLWREQQRARMTQNLSQSQQVGKNNRDFALLRYTDRRNADTWLSNVFPFHYWYTRTAYNWTQRAFMRPAAAQAYVRFRMVRDQQHAAMPEYLRQALSTDDLGIRTDYPLYFNHEGMFNPLHQFIGSNFEDRDKEQARILGTNIGRVAQDIGNVGPAMWAPWQWGIAASQLDYTVREGQKPKPGEVRVTEQNRDTASAWFGTLSNQSRAIRAITAYAHAISNIGQPGGINLDPLVALGHSIRTPGDLNPGYTRSLTKYDENRLVEEYAYMLENPQEFAHLYPNRSFTRDEWIQEVQNSAIQGPVTKLDYQAQQDVSLSIDAYKHGDQDYNYLYDAALQRSIEKNVPRALFSFGLGWMYQGTSQEKERVTDYWKRHQYLSGLYETDLDQEEISELYRQFQVNDPLFDIVPNLRNGQTERNDHLVRSAISAAPNGVDILVDTIGDDTAISRFFETGSTQYLTAEQRDELHAAALRQKLLLQQPPIEKRKAYLQSQKDAEQIRDEIKATHGEDVWNFRNELLQDAATSDNPTELINGELDQLQRQDPELYDAFKALEFDYFTAVMNNPDVGGAMAEQYQVELYTQEKWYREQQRLYSAAGGITKADIGLGDSDEYMSLEDLEVAHKVLLKERQFDAADELLKNAPIFAEYIKNKDRWVRYGQDVEMNKIIESLRMPEITLAGDGPPETGAEQRQRKAVEKENRRLSYQDVKANDNQLAIVDALVAKDVADQTWYERTQEQFVDELFEPFIQQEAQNSQVKWEQLREEPVLYKFPVSNKGIDGLRGYVAQNDAASLREAMMNEALRIGELADDALAWRVMGTILEMHPDDIDAAADRYPELKDMREIFSVVYGQQYPTREVYINAMGMDGKVSADGKASVSRHSVWGVTAEDVFKAEDLMGSLVTDEDDNYVSTAKVHEFIRRWTNENIEENINLKYQEYNMLWTSHQYAEALQMLEDEPNIQQFELFSKATFDAFNAAKNVSGSDKWLKYLKQLKEGERPGLAVGADGTVASTGAEGVLAAIKEFGLDALPGLRKVKKEATSKPSSRPRTTKGNKEKLALWDYEVFKQPQRRQQSRGRRQQQELPPPDLSPWTNLMDQWKTDKNPLLVILMDFFDLSAYARQAHLQRNPNLARWLSSIKPEDLAKIEQAYYLWAQQTGRISPRQERRIQKSRPNLATTLRVYKPRGTRAGL